MHLGGFWPRSERYFAQFVSLEPISYTNGPHAWLLDYRTGDSSKGMEGEDSKATLSFSQSGGGKKEERGEQSKILKDKMKIGQEWMLLEL